MAQPVTTFDQYTALMFMAGLDPDHSISWSPPAYIPDDHVRRRHAYRILYSMITNSARFNMTQLTAAEQRQIREYGDPRLLIDRIVAGILGTGAQVSVRGATQPPLEAPEIPDKPEPAEGADEIETLIASTQLEVWERRTRELVEEWASDWAAFPQLETRQRWLDEWWDTEQVSSKIYEVEANGAVPLGDGVIVMAWSTEKQRPILTVYEPDAYIPVLDDDTTEDFPTKVHLVWEFEDDKKKRFLRRITYELVELDEAVTYPWASTASKVVCQLTDLTFSLNTTGISWPDLDDSAAHSVGTNEDGEQLVDFPLGIDFIPVIHIPNTPATSGHFGVSSLTNVAQLLGDLASVDTDVGIAGSIAGNPTLGAAGVNAGDLKVKAGTIISLPVDGKLFNIDMSSSLMAVLELADKMLDRLSVNAQVPAVVLGRGSEQAESGVALKLRVAPFEQLVSVLRLTRFTKYGLMVKFAQRLAQVGGTLGAGPTPIVDLTFTTTIPADVQSTVEQVARLLEANGLPRAVGLAALRDVGYEIGSIEDAVQAIQSEDNEGARARAEAVQNEEAAAQYLGIDIPEQPTEDDGTPAGPETGATQGEDLPGPIG